MAAKRSRVPLCASCGRKLPKYKEMSRNVWLSARNHLKITNKEPDKVDDYIATNAQIRQGVIAPFTADGLPPTRGSYGDNLVCSQVCGHVLAVRLVIALGGPDQLLKLLPDAWRFR